MRLACLLVSGRWWSESENRSPRHVYRGVNTRSRFRTAPMSSSRKLTGPFAGNKGRRWQYRAQEPALWGKGGIWQKLKVRGAITAFSGDPQSGGNRRGGEGGEIPGSPNSHPPGSCQRLPLAAANQKPLGQGTWEFAQDSPPEYGAEWRKGGGLGSDSQEATDHLSPLPAPVTDAQRSFPPLALIFKGVFLGKRKAQPLASFFPGPGTSGRSRCQGLHVWLFRSSQMQCLTLGFTGYLSFINQLDALRVWESANSKLICRSLSA